MAKKAVADPNHLATTHQCINCGVLEKSESSRFVVAVSQRDFAEINVGKMDGKNMRFYVSPSKYLINRTETLQTFLRTVMMTICLIRI